MDLDGLFKRAFDGFGEDPEPAGFPGVPGSDKASGNDQPIANTSISRVSRISRSENRDLVSDHGSEKIKEFSGEDRAREVPFKTPGNPGNPGKEVKTPAETATSLFPEREKVPGNAGKSGAFCEPSQGHFNSMSSKAEDFVSDPTVAALLASFPDPAAAKPQRSDWWTGPAMAEADRLAPSAEPLPISAADVHAGVNREIWALIDAGVKAPEADRRAAEITRAKIQNSEALAERQAHGGRCHHCNDALDDNAPVIAILTGKRGAHLHLHAACHDAYSARRVALIDRIMAAAGYGPASDGDDR